MKYKMPVVVLFAILHTIWERVTLYFVNDEIIDKTLHSKNDCKLSFSNYILEIFMISTEIISDFSNIEPHILYNIFRFRI